MKPYPLRRTFQTKLWGATDLEPWFPRSETKIGEVWFTDESALPILVKFLFTSERLSVQVHPDDAFAQKHEGSPGKTEMWHILRAEPGAKIALGFRELITNVEQLRESAVSGEIENLLRWIPVKAGETYFVPARTVHAIGPGLALCEIQQQSDVTYRLYDYGRDRELHLSKALAVADLGCYDGGRRPLAKERHKLLASCQYFATESIEISQRYEYEPDTRRFHLLIFLEGNGAIADSRFSAGAVWLVPAGAQNFQMDPDSAVRLLRSYVP